MRTNHTTHQTHEKANVNGLFWFTNDLRLHDNPALATAARSADTLLCVYCINSDLLTPNRFGSVGLGAHRQRFLHESLVDLRQKLAALNQELLIIEGSPARTLANLIDEFKIDHIFASRNAGWNENKVWQSVTEHCSESRFTQIDSHTLFDLDSLPFDLQNLPASFTQFRKIIEQHNTEKPITTLIHLPPPPFGIKAETTIEKNHSDSRFKGGEAQGLAHLTHYFSGNLPANYKQVRNAIDGWDNSCKLSPWLANGSLSSREVLHWLHEYELNKIKNESTYWIYFELLWREYFHWLAHKIGTQLFSFSGLKSAAPLSSYYPERFKKWVAGNTPYPLVNACMKELAATGYLSNRGRQIVASCLVNELSIDWRYGAAYFEQVLLDYDVAANWGNWQYLAGVGVDTRNKRHFNLDKQTQLFDPAGEYRSKWHAEKPSTPLDSMDAADWPI